jgi:hypothetical protein
LVFFSPFCYNAGTNPLIAALNPAPMNVPRVFRNLLIFCAIAFCGFNSSLRAQPSYAVTASGLSAFVFNATSNNPTLTFTKGVTYIFNLSGLSIHPFWIKSVRVTGNGSAYNSGVSNNGSTVGPVSFTPPADAPATLFYQCGNHVPMTGDIHIVAPVAPLPPSGLIVLVSINDNYVTMQSIGATNWNAFPEFRSNLLDTAWATVPNFTNVLANGTNTTTFNRLDAICGPNVFLRVRNTYP